MQCETDLGRALTSLGDPKAEATLQRAATEALELDKEVDSPTGKNEQAPPANSELQLALAGSQIELGKFHAQNKQFEAAENEYMNAKGMAEHWREAAPEAVTWEEALAEIYDGLGDVYLSRNELDQANDWYKRTLGILEELNRPETISGERMLFLAVSEYKLASLGELAGNKPKAVENHRAHATAILTQLRNEGRLPPIAQAWPEFFARAR